MGRICSSLVTSCAMFYIVSTGIGLATIAAAKKEAWEGTELRDWNGRAESHEVFTERVA
jgi:hypothetical protein